MDASIMRLKDKIFLLSILLLALPIASSQIIGGEVTVEGEISPAWQNVFVYDIDNPSSYVEVQVSPELFRYSFSNLKDAESGEEIFSSDSTLQAEVLDFENNLLAGPTKINLSEDNSKEYSCLDCDIFDKMELNRIIDVRSPSRDLYVSSSPDFYLEPSTFHLCDTYLLKDGIYQEFNDSLKNQVGIFGKNEFYIIADCNIGKRFKSASIPVKFSNPEKKVFYEKSIEPKNGYLLVSFYGAKSSGITTITDFIPDEYEVFDISSGGVAYDEDGYYATEWKDITSESFSLTYKIKPKEKFLSCDMGLEGLGKIKSSMSQEVLNSEFTNTEGELIDISDEKFYMDCNFSEEISFYIVDSVDFKRSADSIALNKRSKIKLKVSSIEKLNQVQLKEYVPKPLVVYDVSSGGVVDESNQDYNVITWTVNDKTTEVSYYLEPEELGEYDFYTELGGELIDQDTIKVSIFTRPPKETSHRNRGGGGMRRYVNESIYKYIPENFTIASPTNPIIAKRDNLLVALYPNTFRDKSAMDIYEFLYNGVYDRRLDYIKSYDILTNLNSSERGKMIFEYEINKSLLEDNEYKDIKFYNKKENKFSPISGHVISSTEDTVRYSLESSEPISNIFIFAEKEKLELRDKIIIFIQSAIEYLSRFRP